MVGFLHAGYRYVCSGANVHKLYATDRENLSPWTKTSGSLQLSCEPGTRVIKRIPGYPFRNLYAHVTTGTLMRPAGIR